MERTHRKLCAGFTDGLRGNHANRFAEFHHTARCEVAAVAQRANTAAGFAGEHGANSHPFDARGLHGIGQLFSDFLVDFDDYVSFEVLDLVERNATHDAVAQRLDFDAGFDNRLDVNAFVRAAVEFVDDDVLRHIHQAAREVARVRGL